MTKVGIFLPATSIGFLQAAMLSLTTLIRYLSCIWSLLAAIVFLIFSSESSCERNLELQQDAKEVWLELIRIYMQAEVKDIGHLISKLDDPIQ
jgi:hypothetical protein